MLAGVTGPAEGHIFVSYAHDDHSYVAGLVAAFEAAGLRVWWDADIRPGRVWNDELERAIDECSAVVVVMSPAAKASTWVNKEILHAQHRRKTILPLLLAGEHFFSLGDVQSVDVRRGQLPP